MTKEITRAALLAATLLLPCAAFAQAFPVELPNVVSPADAPQGAGTLPAAQLEQLVAPIALYPDPLLTDILAASTYPAQVAEAQRFVDAHQGLQGDALAEGAAAHHWDASVQALLQYPQVLQQMDTDLEWTDRLGQAFVAQQADVLNAIQRLRQRAEAAGSLAAAPQADVVNEGGDIAILPPSDQQVFVPSYDDACVYGAAACGNDAIDWGDGVWLPYGFEAWGVLDWGRRRIEINGHHGGHGGWGRGGGVGRRGEPGVWRHQGVLASAPGRAPGEIGGLNRFPDDPGGLGHVLHGVPDDGHFTYAPSEGERIARGFATRPIMPRPIGSAGFERGAGARGMSSGVHAVSHAGAPAPVAHGGFGGGMGHR